MAGGVAVSAGAAWFVAHNTALANALFAAGGLTTLGWVVTLAPLGLVLVLSAGIDRLGASAAGLIFLVYAALVGLSLGGLLLAYTGSSLAATFLGAAAGFAALAWSGTTARRDLSGFQSFFTIALVGLLASMLINLLLRSPAFELALSAAGILLFAGLTAFDAQRFTRLYSQSAREDRQRLAIVGALTLYLDFLNLFLLLLRFSGRRRR
jgi:FtsH-binding integral membrane protein